jgi:hypothetical protein
MCIISDSLPGWNKTMRVVVSLTTLPGREALVVKAIESIRRQTWQPDAIILCIPCNRSPHVKLPNHLEDVTICLLPDMGPAMKLLPALAMEHDPNTYIITIDDDVEYPEGLIDRLIRASILFPNSAIGFTGWSVSDSSAGVPVLCHMNQERPGCRLFQPVQVLEGTRGILYKRSFFSGDIHNHARALTEFLYHDDILFSGYLASHGIRRIVRWYDLFPDKPSLKWVIHCQSEGLHTTQNWFQLGWKCWNYWSSGEINGIAPTYHHPFETQRLHIIVEGSIIKQVSSTPSPNSHTDEQGFDEIIISVISPSASNTVYSHLIKYIKFLRPGGVMKLIPTANESLIRYLSSRSSLLVKFPDLCELLEINSEEIASDSLYSDLVVSLESQDDMIALFFVKNESQY